MSDARLGHFDRLLAEFEDLTEIPPDRLVRVDTEGPPEEALVALLKEGCSRRALQIDERMS